VLLALVFLRVIQDYIVVPRVMGQHIHLHPAVVIVAVLCGAELAGTAGVFLATPVAAIVRVLLMTWRRSQPSGDLATSPYFESAVSVATPAQPTPTH
jgi:predicted PurR-regulated permease PerM